MHAFTSILLLSLSSMSLPIGFQVFADFQASQIQPVAYSQVLAAKTQEDGPLRPKPGRKEPRPFFCHHWEI
jgi:hypothetical protein